VSREAGGAGRYAMLAGLFDESIWRWLEGRISKIIAAKNPYTFADWPPQYRTGRDGNEAIGAYRHRLPLPKSTSRTTALLAKLSQKPVRQQAYRGNNDQRQGRGQALKNSGAAAG